ncbi:MAG: hypothetical protein LBV50_04870, partial [Novosphingobium sp.]|nr:hypothetical protein [Novosphingobium sp.]
MAQAGAIIAIGGGVVTLGAWLFPETIKYILEKAQVFYPFIPQAGDAVNVTLLMCALFVVVFLFRLIFMAPYQVNCELYARIEDEAEIKRLHDERETNEQRRHEERMESDRRTRNMQRFVNAKG